MKFALLLNKIEREDYKIIGGKALNLSRLCQRAFYVPQGFCLTVDSYNAFLRENNIIASIKDLFDKYTLKDYKKIEFISQKTRNFIMNGKIPDEVLEAIKERQRELDCNTFVVRSSATAEDLAYASFAGQYDSYLNLKCLEDIIAHIKKCYASLWTNRAISYRIKNNIPPEDTDIAIIVQEMVPAKVSGVLFTANPVTGNRSEMLIESNFGLGESVMSGQTTPDQFIIQWNKKNPSSIEIINKRVGDKSHIVQAKASENESGTERMRLSEEKAKESSLKQELLIKLVRLGSEIEQIFKDPQDIEWAIDFNDKLYVLQTRPITSLGQGSLEWGKGEEWYTRGYSDDYWNDPVSPLFFDLLGDQLTKVVNIELNSIMGYKRMDAKLLKLFKGHVYFNLDVLKRKVEYEIPKIVRNENILNYFPRGKGKYGKETMKALNFHLIDRIVAELRIMVFDPNGSISKTDNAYYEWTENEFIPFCRKFDRRLATLKKREHLRGLLSLAQELDDCMVSHFRLVRYGIPVHNIGMNLITQYLLIKFLGKKDASKYFPLLISGLDHKLTETNEQIYSLASIIQNSHDLRAIITNIDSENILLQLKSEKDPEVRSFLTQFQSFLEACGGRGFTREPYYPRWGEDPSYVFDILKSLIEGQDIDWKKKKDINKIRTKLAERRVEKKIRSQFLGFFKWKLFSLILNLSRRYICFRENQRYNLDVWITKNRNVFLGIGKLFQQKGLLDKENDIFFLRRKEIKNIVRIGLKSIEVKEVKQKVSKRKEIFLKYEHKTPPKFLGGSQQFDDTIPSRADEKVFHGIPASQGITEGYIRILNEIKDIPRVKSGEILIVPRTDPGWTPVFSKIGGLITETGGVLSHGAVVSREYNVPAVTNIPNATTLFNTGQRVRINGFNGEVIILSK